MRSPLRLHRLVLGFALVLLSGSTPAHAMEQDQPSLMESWTLTPGSVFEILAVSDAADRQITWSLTKADGSFVQADRGPLFRERFMETGDYLLKGEVAAADRTPVAQRTFAIHIVTDAPGTTADAGENPLVTTDPPCDTNGNTEVGTDQQTLLVQANPGATQLSMDMDGGRDANGDGDPTNDHDSRGTFFETDGSALRLWFTDGITQRALTIRGVTATGPLTQTIRLFSGSVPVPSEVSQQQPVASPNGLELVRIEQRGSGSYAFSVDTSALFTEGHAILLYWDFGDGRQSMLDRPVHAYAQNGQYVVSLHVRDLQTTEEVLRVTGLLPVNTVKSQEQPSSAQSSSALSSETSSSTTSSSRFSLRSIATIVGGLLLAIFVGFALVVLIGKIVQRRLDTGPANPPAGTSAKKSPPSVGPPSLVQPPPLSVATDVAPPMSVIDMEPTSHVSQATKPLEKSEQTDPSSKLNELSFQEEEAPDWLKQGHGEAEKRGLTVATAAPALEEPVEPAPPEPAEALEKEKRPLPPWLEPAPVAPVETTPPASPEPPVPAPKIPATPAPEPVVPLSPVLTPPLPAPAPVGETKKELSEAERSRRRKKRARYRQNKKMREDTTMPEETSKESSPAQEPGPVTTEPAAPAPETQEELPVPAEEPQPPKATEEADEPIAIIRAENISQEQKGTKRN